MKSRWTVSGNQRDKNLIFKRLVAAISRPITERRYSHAAAGTQGNLMLALETAPNIAPATVAGRCSSRVALLPFSLPGVFLYLAHPGSKRSRLATCSLLNFYHAVKVSFPRPTGGLA